MSTVQRIAKNTGVLLISQIASYLLAFFYMMYTARYLGAEGFGILSFALALTAIFCIFADLGLSTLTVREVSRDKSLASKYLANVSLMKVALSILTFGVMALVINLMGYPQQTINVVYLVGLAVILISFTQMFYSIFQAFERMEYQSMGQVLYSTLILIGVILAMKYGFSVLGFASLYLFAGTITLLYSFVILRWKFSSSSLWTRRNIEMDWGFWKQSFKEAWPMGAMAIGIMIYFRIDAVMISIMKSDADVGLYSAAYRLSELSTFIPSMFMASAFPVMSQYYRISTSSFNMAYEKSVKYLFSIALPMALIVTLLARPIINLIYGAEFVDSASALRVLIWAAAIMYASMVAGTTFITANKQMLSLKLVIVSAVFNIVLNLIVIPKYSYVGASATTVATEAFGLLIGIFFLSRSGYKLNVIDAFLPPAMSLCASLAISLILIDLGVNIFIISIVAVIVYAPIIYRIGIKEDDKQIIKNLFNLRNTKTP